MKDLIKIDNKYVKVELKGKTEYIFKIAKAIAKTCEEIKIEEEKEKIEVNNELTKKIKEALKNRETEVLHKKEDKK